MFKYFSKAELLLYISSMTLITASFLLFDRTNYLTLLASLIGATSLIFCAKGNPIGQVLIILFSIIYAIISFSCAYYGEMITYLGMTAPMAMIALISWIKHPYNGNHSEVCVNSIGKKETVFMFVLTVFVTVAFYFILSRLGTSNLAPSLFSVTTSFIAVYLTYRRSPFFAVAYAVNDIVLIVLWALASANDTSYIPVLVCFATFLANDMYSFSNWRKMQKRQTTQSSMESPQER